MRAALLVFLVACSGSTESVSLSRSPDNTTTPAHVSLQSARPGASRVVFVGNHDLSREELLAVMSFPANGPYPEEALERDVLLLCAHYYDRGYVNARVDTPEITGDKVRIRITEGPRFRVGRVEAHDLDEHGAALSTPDGAPTRSHFRARAGEWFNRRVFIDDLETIRGLYRSAGYANVQVEPVTEVNSERASIDIVIEHIELGPRVTP